MKKLLLFFAIIAVNTIVWYVCFLKGCITPEEYGTFENIQSFFLAIALVLYVLKFSSCRQALYIVFYGIWLVLMYNFLLREIDVPHMKDAAPHWAHFWFGNGPGYIATFAILYGSLFVGLIKNFKPIWRFFIEWTKSAEGWAMMIGGVLLGMGSLFDQQMLGFSALEGKFFEECMELNAYILISISAYYAFKRR